MCCTVTGKINSALSANNNTGGITETLGQCSNTGGKKKKKFSLRSQNKALKQALVNYFKPIPC